jgi:hypothetical protein
MFTERLRLKAPRLGLPAIEISIAMTEESLAGQVGLEA